MVAEARALIGTPFRHQGRVPHVGLDCIGLLIAVAKKLGFEWTDRRGYGRSPDGRLLCKALDECCDRANEAAVGRIVGFEYYKGLPQHAGIISNYAHGGFGLIHTYADAGCVSEHVLELEEASVVGYWTWRPETY